MSMSRQTTTPFHLKLFYRQSTYHPLSDFSPASANPAGRSGGHLPAHHLQIYTWPSCSLRELAHLLTSTLPHLLPEVPIGTRLSFRLIYPDTKGAAMNLGEHGRGRYLAKEMGSVVVAPRGYDDDTDSNEGGKGEGEGEGEGGGHGSKARAAAAGAFRMSGADAEKTLQDFRFVIGDYVDCAIVPPLEDGSVAPPPPVGSGGGGGGGGGGMRAFPQGGREERSYFGRGGGRGGRGFGGGLRERERERERDRDRERIPPGDWRRGERLPEGDGGGRRENGGRERDRDGGRRGWMPY